MRNAAAVLLFVLIGLGAFYLAGDPAGPRSAAAAGRELLRDEIIEVFKNERIRWEKEEPELVDPNDESFVVRFRGHSVERSVDLPAIANTHRDARRIVVQVRVRPIQTTTPEGRRPNDPWPRLGRVAVVLPGPDGRRQETELLRFITGFGGSGTFEQDVTALAPLLHGRRTIVASLSTFSQAPGWRVSVSLRYSETGVGQRSPALAEPIFENPHVTADRSLLRATVMIPEGVDRPRIRITSTGHATDGSARNEFVSCTHILRIDGEEVARWRPWAESGGILRERNPWAGRDAVDGREIWSSDLDRAGWHPGLAVEPLIIPVPELTPGRHAIELAIQDIRAADPGDPKGAHGYWVVSGMVVADRPWLAPVTDAETGSNPAAAAADE